MLRIRLQRRGKKNYATYRVVVADSGAPIKGRYIADLGPYNPHTDTFTVNKEEAQSWIEKGAKPTPTVHNLLVEHGLIKGEKVTSWTPKKSAEEADAKTPTEAPAKESSEETEKKEEPSKESSEETK